MSVFKNDTAMGVVKHNMGLQGKYRWAYVPYFSGDSARIERMPKPHSN